MTEGRKYANLPDLDQAPEVYQTLEDEDTITTSQKEGTASSRASSEENSDDEDSRIERGRIDPNSARSQFTTARVDASKANFSDQVGRHKRSYYATRSIRHEDEEDLDPEQRLRRPNLSRRINRMQQLMEELQGDIEASKEKGEWRESSQEHEDTQDEVMLAELSESLRDLTTTDRGSDSAVTRMKKRASMKRDAIPVKLRSDDSSTSAPIQANNTHSYSRISDPQAMAVYTKVSSRLETLEKLLGLDSIPPSDLPTVKDFPLPIIKMTDIMARQMSLLNGVEEPFLDQLSKRINTLTVSATRLDEKRKEAQKGYEDLMAARDASTAGFSSSNGYSDSPRSPTLSGTTRLPGMETDARNIQFDATHPLVDPELPSKIAALHSTLPTIENLAPMLHPVLERLRALKEVHQDASSADTRLTELEQHEIEIQKQLKTWRDTVAGLEEQTNELEEEWLENMTEVETKVKDLERRIRAL